MGQLPATIKKFFIPIIKKIVEIKNFFKKIFKKMIEFRHG